MSLAFESQSNQSDWQISKALYNNSTEKKQTLKCVSQQWYQKRIGNSLISIYLMLWWMLKWHKPFRDCPLKKTAAKKEQQQSKLHTCACVLSLETHSHCSQQHNFSNDISAVCWDFKKDYKSDRQTHTHTGFQLFLYIRSHERKRWMVHWFW